MILFFKTAIDFTFGENNKKCGKTGQKILQILRVLFIVTN
jgi:hypothetical protein